MVILKLVHSGIRAHPARAALTLLAVAMSVSLVVAVTSGYTSARAAIFRYFASVMGTTDVRLTRQGDPNGRISASIVDQLKRDRDVERAVPRLEVQSPLLDAEGKPLPQQRFFGTSTVIGVRLPDDADVAAMSMEPETTGGWFGPSDVDAVVLDQETARTHKLVEGSRISIASADGTLTLRVTGIVHKPQILAAFQTTAYVPLETLQKFLSAKSDATMIVVDLKPGVDHAEFAERWRKQLATAHPEVKVATARESRKQVEDNLEGVRALSMLGGAVSMLAAGFIVFTTLSMGVSERQRMLAMLRAVGAYRRQIAMLVVVEGLALAIAGALLGVPLGCLWVELLVRWKAHFFQAGTVLDPFGITYGSLGSVLVAVAASLLPAWNAMRLDPVAAMSVLGRPASGRFPIRPAMCGLALIAVDPILMFAPAIGRTPAFYGHFALGLPSLMIGFFLLAPAFVWIVEKVFAPAVSTMLRLRNALLAQQLTTSMWRAAGTAAALMVGLSILVVMQTQGRSVTSAWRIPDKFPDIFIAAPLGLNAAQAKTLIGVDGIKRDEVMPIAVSVAGLPLGTLSLLGAAVLPDATMFLGIDPDRALKMMELEYREGSAAEATAKLKLGRHLIVTEEFRQLKGLHVGDKMKLKTPQSGVVEYEIAAIIWSPGMEVFVSMFDLGRQFDERSAASVFGSLEDAKRDFGIERYHLFAANLEPSVERPELAKRVSQKLGSMGLIYGDVRHIKAEIQRGFGKLLLLLSTVAFFAMIVASLGVTNALMASVRSRRWQFGVLRSIGAQRGLVLRLIFGEALLLGLVGSMLGLAAGLLLSVDANGLMHKTTGFRPPMVIAWDMVGIGIAIVMGVAMLASLYPAIHASREEPLSLLQAGRAGA